jgi:hypothetical protein
MIMNFANCLENPSSCIKVCKTFIHRFDSDPRLQQNSHLIAFSYCSLLPWSSWPLPSIRPFSRVEAEIERLRRLVESQARTIKKLECRLTESTPSPRTADPEIRLVSTMGREALISSLAGWRAEHGVSDPQRYLRNRSTDQLRKMYSQVHQAGTVTRYQMGRRWKSTKRGSSG